MRKARHRLYGLYEKRGHRWFRLYPSVAGQRGSMARLCQGALLAYAVGDALYPRALRPLSGQDVAERATMLAGRKA